MGAVGVIYETVLAAELEPAPACIEVTIGTGVGTALLITATWAAALLVARRTESMMNLVLVNIVRAG